MQESAPSPTTRGSQNRPKRTRAPPSPQVREDEPADIAEVDGSDEDVVVDHNPDGNGYEAIMDDDNEDWMTDDGIEAEVEHPAEEIRWNQTKVWEVEARTDAFKKECGEAVWHAPALRDQVKSLPTGPEQDCTFNVDVQRSACEHFLDALPVNGYWTPLAKQSWKYSQQQQRLETGRPLKRKWFTAANYLRCFATIIMGGLVEARDNAELFAGTTRGTFHRTGAEEVCGITLNVYEQLMRFLHLVDNKHKKANHSDQFDKCFVVRPLIKRLQDCFIRWCNPGKNNAMDEGGIPSRSRWMRTFNPSKPNKYFMEILMACDSVTRFCWSFFVTESALKTVINRHRRGRNKSMLSKVTHYQYEYNDRERKVQERFGSATAQMLFFARFLREHYPDSPVTYRIFVDRRWDSIPATVLAKKEYNVSYTMTVKTRGKYHITRHWGGKGGGNAIVKSKKRNKRGKYRSATTTIAGVRLNECLWNDSSLLGGCSADLGCENTPVVRRMGRHRALISCPKMMSVRGKNLRGVDVHDQLRASKYRMIFQSKKKAWPKLWVGLKEILVVNIYVMKKTSLTDLRPDDMRWTLLLDLVQQADILDVQALALANEKEDMDVGDEEEAAVVDLTRDSVGRFEGADLHHHDKVEEYVTPEQAKANAIIAAADPPVREYMRQPRERDQRRKNNKVRNPLFTSASVCIVCKYHHGRRRETLKYCRECSVERFTSWPKTNRATGFATKFHPRLCSKECFRYFHTHNIKGLDFAQKKKRTRKATRVRAQKRAKNRVCTPVPNRVETRRTSIEYTPNGGRVVPRGLNNSPRRENTRHDV